MLVKVPTSSTLYSKGVFTTIAICDGKPWVWEKHWRRLTENAAMLGIDLAEETEDQTRSGLKDAISETGIANGRARITFSDETQSPIWSQSTVKKTALSIIIAKCRPVPANFRLTISPHRVNTTSPLVGIKSCNYLEHLLAFEEASERGFHEAVRANERGEIASVCMANVFWTKDGNLFTPSLKTGCLAGTTREYILENLDCEEVETGVEDLVSADRIFLTSSGISAIAAAEFEGRRLDTSEHPLLSLLPF